MKIHISHTADEVHQAAKVLAAVRALVSNARVKTKADSDGRQHVYITGRSGGKKH